MLILCTKDKFTSFIFVVLLDIYLFSYVIVCLSVCLFIYLFFYYVCVLNILIFYFNLFPPAFQSPALSNLLLLS